MHWLLRRLPCVVAVTFSLFVCVVIPPNAEQRVLAHELQPAEPIAGSLLIVGGGPLPAEIIDRFFVLAGAEKARIIIVTTASSLAGTPDAVARHASWFDRKFDSIKFLHTRRREEANDPFFSQCLNEASGIWFMGGNQNWLAEAYLGTLVEERCHDLLKRGGVIGGTSAGAAIMSKVMIAGGYSDPFVASGFGFLPGTIIDQHFKKRSRQSRLLKALDLCPGLVGIGIDESTALVVSGRSLQVVGNSDVSLYLAGTSDRMMQKQTLLTGQTEDFVGLSQAAVARTKPHVSGIQHSAPEVKKGTLIIVGGGPLPPEAIARFLMAAGGNESPLIIVSNAIGDDSDDKQVSAELTAAGASNVHHIHSENGSQPLNADFRAVLEQARGVWFTGGRLGRQVNTGPDGSLLSLLQQVLLRGGVIGGTSAGATIEGEDRVLADSVGNQELVADGYQQGFVFLPGAAIDQHFTKCDRLGDRVRLKRSISELVGIGIDDATAMIVRGTIMEVVGSNQVAVFDRQPDDSQAQPEFSIIKTGQKYDFKHRRLLGSTGLPMTETK